MRSLTEIIEEHKANRDIAALVVLREDIHGVIHFVRDRIAEMLQDKDPKPILQRAEKNLAQAEKNFAGIQAAIDELEKKPIL